MKKLLILLLSVALIAGVLGVALIQDSLALRTAEAINIIFTIQIRKKQSCREKVMCLRRKVPRI